MLTYTIFYRIDHGAIQKYQTGDLQQAKTTLAEYKAKGFHIAATYNFNETTVVARPNT